MSQIKTKEDTNNINDNMNVCNVDLENEYINSCGENTLTKSCNKFILKKRNLMILNMTGQFMKI